VAEAKLAQVMIDHGFTVRLGALPLTDDGEQQGPDDFLHRHGAEALDRVLSGAMPASPAAWAQEVVKNHRAAARQVLKHLPFIASLSVAGPSMLDTTAKVLKEFFGIKDLRKAAAGFQSKLMEQARSAERSRQSPATTVTQMLNIGDHVEVATAYLKDLGAPAVYDQGDLHVYEGCVWKQLPRDAEVGRISRYSGTPVRTKDGVRPLKLRSIDCQGIFEIASAKSIKQGFFDSAPEGLTFENVFVTVEGRQVVTVEPEGDHAARFAYPFAYDQKAEAPGWMKFLDDIFADDVDREEKKRALQEFTGACLFGVAPRFKKCLILIGDTDSGKSTCIHVLRACFPSGTTAAVPPAEWGSDYKRAMLAGKLLNIVAELPEREWIETEPFKAFVGDDAITARRIYSKPFTFRYRGGHIFAANTLPRIGDRTEATWNRLLLLTCNNRFHRAPSAGGRKAEDGLAHRLASTEMPGIIAWAVEGYQRLLLNGSYTVPPSSMEALNMWRNGSDPLVEFFDTWLEISPKDNLPTMAACTPSGRRSPATACSRRNGSVTTSSSS
jgi:P4 family phage/plasmid primase-like protien